MWGWNLANNFIRIPNFKRPKIEYMITAWLFFADSNSKLFIFISAEVRSCALQYVSPSLFSFILFYFIYLFIFYFILFYLFFFYFYLFINLGRQSELIMNGKVLYGFIWNLENMLKLYQIYTQTVWYMAYCKKLFWFSVHSLKYSWVLAPPFFGESTRYTL